MCSLERARLLFAAEVLAKFPEGLISVMAKLALTPLCCHCFSLTNVTLLNQLDCLSEGTFFIYLKLRQLRWYDNVTQFKVFFLMFKAMFRPNNVAGIFSPHR